MNTTTTREITTMNNVTTHLQIARWRLSHEIDIEHEFWECGDRCEHLHDAQRAISDAIIALGAELCDTPIAWYKYKPEGYVPPVYPGAELAR